MESCPFILWLIQRPLIFGLWSLHLNEDFKHSLRCKGQRPKIKDQILKLFDVLAVGSHYVESGSYRG